MNVAPRMHQNDWLILAGLTLLALVLRIPQLDHGIWLDEIITMQRCLDKTLAEIISSPFRLNNHLFYSILGRSSMLLFGESTWAIRLPAMLMGVATIPALYYFCRQLGRRDVAVLCALFLAVNYYHIWFSQNARGYSGLALGAVASSILILKILKTEKNDWKLWAAYVFTAFMSAGIHILGSLVIVAHALLCFFLLLPELRDKRWNRVAYVASLFVVSGLLSLTIYFPSLAGLQEALSRLYAPELHKPNYEIEHAESWATNLVGRILANNRNIPGGVFTLYILGLVALAGILNTLRRGRLDSGLVLMPIVFTILVVFVASSYFLPRFFFACAPFMVIIACRGGFALGEYALPFLRRKHLVVAACLVALTSTALVPHAWKPKQDLEGLDEWLNSEMQQGDNLTCMYLMSYMLDKQLNRDCPRFDNLDEFKKLESPGQRNIVLVTRLADRFDDDNRALPSYMSGRYELVKRFPATVLSGRIEIFVSKPTTLSTAHSITK